MTAIFIRRTLKNILFPEIIYTMTRRIDWKEKYGFTVVVLFKFVFLCLYIVLINLTTNCPTVY